MRKLKMTKLSITLCVFIQLCAVQTEMVNKNTAHGKHVLKSTNILQDIFTLI